MQELAQGLELKFEVTVPCRKVLSFVQSGSVKRWGLKFKVLRCVVIITTVITQTAPALLFVFQEQRKEQVALLYCNNQLVGMTVS